VSDDARTERTRSRIASAVEEIARRAVARHEAERDGRLGNIEQAVGALAAWKEEHSDFAHDLHAKSTETLERTRAVEALQHKGNELLLDCIAAINASAARSDNKHAATAAGLESVRSELRADISAIESHVERELGAVRSEVAALKTGASDTGGQLASIRKELTRLRNLLPMRLWLAIVGFVVLAAATAVGNTLGVNISSLIPTLGG
jgi:chromosome segregation ATPase